MSGRPDSGQESAYPESGHSFVDADPLPAGAVHGQHSVTDSDSVGAGDRGDAVSPLSAKRDGLRLRATGCARTDNARRQQNRRTSCLAQLAEGLRRAKPEFTTAARLGCNPLLKAVPLPSVVPLHVCRMHVHLTELGSEAH
jgi:hypothetical protein